VYNSVAARTQHEAAGFAAAQGTVIPNGFDLDQFRFDEVARNGLRGALGVADGTVVIGHIARLHASKDHAGFLRAFARIAQTRPFVRAVLAGEGVEAGNAALGALVDQLGIRNRVSLLGRRTDIAALMASFEVFCSSSSGMEGFPNVVAEAMSCEVPCVATDVGDARAVVAGCGEIVPPSDVDSLANALARIVDMPVASRRALGAAARSHIAGRFAIDTVTHRYLQLYEALAAAQDVPACAA
jgi:glycosyltransferase involved in cell wall biosynthesis